MSARFVPMLLLVAPCWVSAQCGPQWLAPPSQPTVNGRVYALKALPDGGLVVGGQLTQAGGGPAEKVARWDGAAWSPLGTGVVGGSAEVYALAMLPSGDLIAAGRFATAGGVPANNIARWDGASWSALGSGLTGASSGNITHVFSLVVLENGDLIAGGEFTTAGGTGAMRIARWDGVQWSALGAGFGSLSGFSPVYALALLPGGDLIAGGQFSFSGATSTRNIARWTGSAWGPLGTGMSNGSSASLVYSLLVMPGGDLMAGGRFGTAGAVNTRSIARWDGVGWNAVGGGVGSNNTDEVRGITRRPNGDLVVCGTFRTAGGSTPVRGLARWDGVAWRDVGGGLAISATHLETAHAVATLTSGELVVGGNFQTVGGLNGPSSPYFARWTDTAVPWVCGHPQSPAPVAVGAQAALSVTAATDYTGLAYRWRRQGVELTDGATPHGSMVAGAQSELLTISNIQTLDAGDYDCVVSNSCGSAMSSPATIVVIGGCYPNCDGSAGIPVLNVNDFVCFQSAFAAGQPYADCNHDTFMNVNDFVCFQSAFAAGCP